MTFVKLSDRTLEPVPVPLGGWLTSPRLRPMLKLAPLDRVMLPPTLSRSRSRPMLMPVPVPLRSMPLSTSSVCTSPPVVIDAPGKIASNAIRSIDDVPGDGQGAGQLGDLEALDGADLAAVTVSWPMFRRWLRAGFPVGEALGEALLLRLAERVDGQLGVGRRAVDDDAHAAARHGIRPDRADRLGIIGVLLGDERGGARAPALAVRSLRRLGRDRIGGVGQPDHVVRAVERRHLDGLAAAGRLGRDRHALPRDAADRILEIRVLRLRRQVLVEGVLDVRDA